MIDKAMADSMRAGSLGSAGGVGTGKRDFVQISEIIFPLLGDQLPERTQDDAIVFTIFICSDTVQVRTYNH